MVDYVNDPHRVKARKEHRCDWCGQKIEAGEEYTVSTLVGDCIYDWHECDRCASYVSEFFKETKPIDYGDGISPIYFNAWMEEAHSDVLEDWRAK